MSRFTESVVDALDFFEDDGGPVVKKMAGYHQFHALRVALSETLRAAQLQYGALGIHGESGRCESGKQQAARPVITAWEWSGIPRARARA